MATWADRCANALWRRAALRSGVVRELIEDTIREAARRAAERLDVCDFPNVCSGCACQARARILAMLTDEAEQEMR